MRERIIEIFPEILEIQSVELQNQVIQVYIDAIKAGNWLPDDMYRIPFTLDFDEFIFSYADHVHGVTAVSHESARQFNRVYASNPKYHVNEDLVIAGALVHDVGKLLEYEVAADGRFAKTAYGKSLRHPISGAILAAGSGCSPELCHIIAVHAAEGDCAKRSPEAIIINKADFLNFDIINTLRAD